MRKARDETAANRIVRKCEHDRDGRRCLLRSSNACPSREDHIYFETNELSRDLREALIPAFGPAIFDSDSATLDPAKFA